MIEVHNGWYREPGYGIAWVLFPVVALVTGALWVAERVGLIPKPRNPWTEAGWR